HLRNVLHDHVGRTDELDETSHTLIEAILWVISSCVIVQVAVPLTRWTTDHYVDRTHRLLEVALLCRRSGSQSSIQQSLEGLGSEPFWSEVCPVNGARLRTYVRSKYWHCALSD